MKLNRTGSNWNELERSKINENWDIIEGSYNDVVGQITDEVVGHLIDSAKLIWKEPVDTVEDLPTNAEVGETRMVREADPDGISYVYRYDGEKWEKIQEIDATLVNEVDRRLTAQLAEKSKEINRLDVDKADKYIVDNLGKTKADKTEVERHLINKIDKGALVRHDLENSLDGNLWDINDFNEKTRGIIQGLKTGDVNAVLGYKNVKKENLADDSVAINSIEFAKKTRNIFKGEYLPIYVDGSNPQKYRVATESENPKTAVIEVNPNTTYTIKLHGISRIEALRIAALENKPEATASWKTSDRNILNRTTGNTEFTFSTKENENYLLVLVSYAGVEYTMQVEEGDVPTSYTPYKVIPNLYLEQEEKEEETVEVHKSLGRKQIVPLVYGTEDEMPAFTGGVLTYDYENKKIGQRSYKIDSISISTARLSFDVDTNTDPVQAVGMWLYVPEPEKVSHAFIRLVKKDGSPDYRVSNRDFLDIGDLKQGWNYLRYPTWRNNNEGLQELSEVSIEIVPTQVPTSVSLSHVWLETSEKAKMIFVEDGQFRTFYEIAYPRFKERNIPVTWALRIVNIGGSVGTESEQITEDIIDQLSKENNNSISFHSFGPKYASDMTPEEVRADVVAAQKWLLERGYSGGVFKGAWFQNNAPNHWAAHDFLVASATPFGNANLTIFPFVNQFKVPRIDLHGSLKSEDSMINVFDKLKENRGTAVIYTHGISERPTDTSREVLDRFINKLDVAISDGWLETTTFELLNKKYKVYDEMKF